MMAATAMSKLFDSLTGYFFSGNATSSTAGYASADDSVDEYAERRSGPAGPSRSPRLRDRLLLRRPVSREVRGDGARPAPVAPSAGHAGGLKPWGDDLVASPRIHPLAVIDPRADLAPDVEVGPFCVIGPHVSIGPGCRLMNNVTILGHTTIGSDNVFHPNCVVGNDPQDKKFRGEETRVTLGDRNIVREAVTIHAGTAVGGGVTRVGDDNLLMVNAHIGHDAIVGSGCVIGNNVMLAGHVHLGDRVSMMGGSACHHFVTIGDLAFVGGYSQIHKDIPPYVKVDGEDRIRDVNGVGLRRAGGFSEADIAALQFTVRRMFVSKKQPVSVVIREMLADPQLNPRAREVIDTIRRRALGKHGRYLEGNR